MAVFGPRESHLREQLASLAAQTGGIPHLIAVIADTTSGPLVAKLANAVGLSFELVEPQAELDCVRAFETGLTHAEKLTQTQTPEPLIALCDQDDIWHKNRLAEGMKTLAASGAVLVHSDARIVDDICCVRHPSLFDYEKRHRTPGLRGLLLRNTVTGMTTLMRPELLRISLPFPQQAGIHFYHDLWLALVAHAFDGGIALIRKPLVDYRQHGDNAVGAVSQSKRKPHIPLRQWFRREASRYALAHYLANCLQSRIARTMPEATVRLRPLRPFTQPHKGSIIHLRDALRLLVQGHFKLARISFGYAAVRFGRKIWILRAALNQGRSNARKRFDTRLHTLSPGATLEANDTPCPQPEALQSYEALIDRRKTPRWQPRLIDEDAAFNVLVPSLNPSEIFAGVASALDIGLEMARRGLPVRFIATDLPIASHAASLNFLKTRAGNKIQTMPGISVHCGVASTELPANHRDIFLATAWWSAFIANTFIKSGDFAHDRFFYLIQDYEPNFYPWGQEFTDASTSYTFPFEPIFNTTLLRRWFQEQGHAFASPQSLTFQPSIDISRYATGIRPPNSETAPKRLALYGRPEVARNMFPTALEALARFIKQENLSPADIQILSIGLNHGDVALPNNIRLESLGKLPWEDYPDFLLGCDIGLSLMLSPHPSHPPLEMAASGMRVVTNTFGPKDLSTLSPAIISTPPNAATLCNALRRSWHAPPVAQHERAFDLTPLGPPLPYMADALFKRLHPLLKGASCQTAAFSCTSAHPNVVQPIFNA